MSIPKEPRQIMINIMYLVLTALLALNVSAEIFNAFKVVDKGLTQANAGLDKANEAVPKIIEKVPWLNLSIKNMLIAFRVSVKHLKNLRIMCRELLTI